MREVAVLLKKDFYRWRWLVFAYVCVATVIQVFAGFFAEHSLNAAYVLFRWLDVVMVPLLIHDDAVAGVHAFWRTRPISAGKLLFAKLLFILGVVVFIPVLSECVFLRANNWRFEELAWALPEIVMETLVFITLLILMAVMTSRISSYAFLCILAFLVYGGAAYLYSDPVMDGALIVSKSIVMAVLMIAGGWCLISLQYMVRKTGIVIAGTILLVCALLLIDFRWPWDFISRVQKNMTDLGTEAAHTEFDFEDFNILDNRYTREDQKSPIDKIFRCQVYLRGLPEHQLAILADLKDVRIEYPDRGIVPMKSTDDFVRRLRDETVIGERIFKKPLLSVLDGTTKFSIGGLSFKEIFRIEDTVFQKIKNREGTYRARAEYDVYEFRITAAFPLEKGHNTQIGSEQVRVDTVRQRPLALFIVIEESIPLLRLKNQDHLELLKRKAKEREESYGQTYRMRGFQQVYALRNASKGEIVFPDGMWSYPEYHTSNPRLMTRRRDIEFNPRPFSYEEGEHITVFDQKWLEGAELIRLDAVKVGRVRDDIELEHFILPETKRDIVMAVWDGNLEEVKTLIAAAERRGEPYDKRVWGEPLLHRAVRRNHPDIVHHLLAKGADLEAVHIWQGSALRSAVMSGHEDMALLLLQHGAQTETRNKHQETALHSAARRGYLKSARNLIDYHANVNVRNDRDETPLMLAASHGKTEMVVYLLAQGADRMAHDVDNKRALHKAAENGHLDVVALLSKKDMDENGRIVDGEFALYLASRRGYKEIVDLLRSYGVTSKVHAQAVQAPQPEQTWHTGVWNHDQKQWDRFVASGKDVDTRDDQKRSALFYAASQGHVDMIDQLVSLGADTDARDQGQQCPLHVATMAGRLESIRALIRHGADVNAISEMDQTPLDVAYQSVFLDAVDVYESVGGQRYQYTSPLSENVSILPGDLMVDHNFHNDEEGWYRSAKAYQYQGQYHVIGDEKGSYSAQQTFPLKRCVMEVETTVIETYSIYGDFAYGFYFRSQPSEKLQAYAFWLNTDGAYCVHRFDDEETFRDLIPWTLSEVIRRGKGAKNHIQVRLWDGTMDFYINGEKVGRVYDNTYQSDQISLKIGIRMEIAFDDFRIYAARLGSE